MMRENETLYTVCFDLGGVLVEICKDWREIAQTTGIAIRQETNLFAVLSQPLFMKYQNGDISDNEYLSALSKELGVTEGQAKTLHQAILSRPYPGSIELVDEIQDAGHLTGCLSNTNSLHWKDLDTDRFPSVEALHFKVVSHEIGLSKPDIGIYHAFEKTTGCTPDRIIYFDDHAENVVAAQKLGWRAFHVPENQDPIFMMRACLVEHDIL